MRKYGLKALGLALLAVTALMAFSASSALAANLNVIDEPETGTAGFFLINKVNTPTGLTHETIGGKQIGSGTLFIPGKSTEIVCEAAVITEAFVQNESENYLKAAGTMKSGGHGHGTVLFLKCHVFKVNPTTLALEGELLPCTNALPALEAEPTNHHITATGLILVKQHEGSTYIIVEPLVLNKANAEENEKLTSAFTKLTFGGTCSLPEKVNITGGIAVKAPETDAVKPKLVINTAEVVEGKHKYSKEQELLGARLKFGANEAFIAAEAEAELTGANKAAAWGAM
jgi:hypothetical protein